jgi:GH24 family phage-related lysozyme (muramidase)
MQMSQEGIDALLKKFEGCKLTSYRCPANVCTIGYGHTSAAGAPAVVDHMKITQKQADDILRRDLVKYETAVAGMVTVDLTQHQFDVLVDFAYNAGVGNLKTSTLLKKVNGSKFEDVPAELMKWNKGGGKVLPGLVRRRQAEGAWWTFEVVSTKPPTPEQAFDNEQENRAEPDPVPVRTMADSKQGNAALMTAGLGTLGVAKEVAAQAKDASDTADQLMGLLSNTNFLVMMAIIGLGAAIWFWRKKHMDEHGV